MICRDKITSRGVCNYSVGQMAEAEKSIMVASNQVTYSMLKKDAEKDLIPFCQKMDKGVLAYSPLQRGLLTGKIKPDTKFGEGDHRAANNFFTAGNIHVVNKFLEKIEPIAYDKGVSLAQLVIRWTIDQPGITTALVGARNAEQTAHNARALDFVLTQEEMELINFHLEQVTLVL